MQTESRYTQDDKESIGLRLNALQLAFEQKQQTPIMLFLMADSKDGFDIIVSDSQVPAKHVIDGMIELFPKYLKHSGMPPDLQLSLGLAIIANLDSYLTKFTNESI